jgi:hypothetical protein
LDAQQKYLKNLELDFSNFYEIAFHYFNLNTVLADKKLYNSSLETINSDQNLLEIVNSIAKRDELDESSKIITRASEILGQTLKTYLERQTAVLKNMHFYFNNAKLHRENKIYIVCRSTKTDVYDVIKLNLASKRPLACSLIKCASLKLPNLKDNEFKDRLIKAKPLLTDFSPEKNVIVCTYDEQVLEHDAIFLTKDLLILNRLVNQRGGFDSNAILDAYRLLEKKKAIPFKLKV